MWSTRAGTFGRWMRQSIGHMYCNNDCNYQLSVVVIWVDCNETFCNKIFYYWCQVELRHIYGYKMVTNKCTSCILERWSLIVKIQTSSWIKWWSTVGSQSKTYVLKKYAEDWLISDAWLEKIVFRSPTKKQSQWFYHCSVSSISDKNWTNLSSRIE